jgi:hypothetical protein
MNNNKNYEHRTTNNTDIHKLTQMEQSVSKHWHINYRRRGIPQKKAYDNIHVYLEFKLTEEENNNIHYLDLSIHRNENNLQLGIYRNPHKQILLHTSYLAIY